MEAPDLAPVPVKVEISNFPQHWSQMDLQSFLKPHGNIMSIEMVRPQCAVVRFQSFTKAEDAIRNLNDHLIGREVVPIKLDFAKGELDRLGMSDLDDSKLFVGSIPKQASEDQLNQIFSRYGPCKVFYRRQKCCAFVKYDFREQSLKAIRALDRKRKVKGGDMLIEVRFAEKKKGRPFDTMPGDAGRTPFPTMPMHAPREYLQVLPNEFSSMTYYYDVLARVSQYERPPPGSKVIRQDNSFYFETGPVAPIIPMETGRRAGPKGANLFIFNVPSSMTDKELYDNFKQFGNVVSAKIMTKDGRSKGFGFVSYDNPASAQVAIDNMNGIEIEGHKLKVQLKKGEELSSR